MGVFNEEECLSRQEIQHEHYIGTVEMECMCLIDMINQHIIPSVKAAGVGPLAELQACVPKLKAELAKLHSGTTYEKAKLARILRLETMIEMRQICDDAEEVCPANLWTLATYKELLFLDQHSNHPVPSSFEEYE
jgi:glutamine synthetase